MVSLTPSFRRTKWEQADTRQRFRSLAPAPRGVVGTVSSTTPSSTDPGWEEREATVLLYDAQGGWGVDLGKTPSEAFWGVFEAEGVGISPVVGQEAEVPVATVG